MGMADGRGAPVMNLRAWRLHMRTDIRPMRKLRHPMNIAKAIHAADVVPALRRMRTLTPKLLYPLAGRLIPWFAIAAALCCSAGLYAGFFVAPSDPLQGESYRIMFLHLPALWLSFVLYLLMSAAAALGLRYRSRAASMLATALAPTAALFAFIALWSGALWGKPNLGAWWLWEPQPTVELLLLLLLLGFIGCEAVIDKPGRADRAGAILIAVGALALPLLYVAMRWANAGQDPARLAAPAAVDDAVRFALAAMLAGLTAYAVAAALARVRSVILERERRTDWVARMLQDRS